MSVLCISYYCPHLCSPGPRWPSQNLIYNLLWDIDALPHVADPIWEPVSNLIMFPLERTVSLDQIRSYSAASGISCSLMEWLSSSTNNPRRNDHEINVILHSHIHRNEFRKQIDSAFVLQLYSIKQSGNKKEAQGIFEKNTSKNKILCISDVVNSWFELASSWNFSSLVCMLI